MINKKLLIGIVIAVSCGASAGWWFTHIYWQKKWQQRDVHDMQIQAAAQKKIKDLEKANQKVVAETDQKFFKELEDAKIEINQLRNAVNSGTRRLQHCQNISSGNAGTATVQSAGMGNNGGAYSRADSTEIEQDILDIGEAAVTAIKQRDACIAVYEKTQKTWGK